MRVPDGRLVRSRVERDPGRALAVALDRSLTGYAVFTPQDSLLLSAEDRGVVTFDAGVPVLAYHTGTGRGGPDALADFTVPGPYRVDLHELDPGDLDAVHDTPELQVPPAMPADQLAGDPDLADRTREVAPAHLRAITAEDAADPVAAFLDDEEKIAAIKARAREDARERASEWGLGDELEPDSTRTE